MIRVRVIKKLMRYRERDEGSDKGSSDKEIDEIQREALETDRLGEGHSGGGISA